MRETRKRGRGKGRGGDRREKRWWKEGEENQTG